MTTIKINDKKIEEIEPEINILLIVHTDKEYDETIKVLKPASFAHNRLYEYSSDFEKYSFGSISNFDVVVAKSHTMGSGNDGASFDIVDKSIRIWKPQIVIMLGICAALNDSMNIGDVVVAKTLIPYLDRKQAKKGIIDRSKRYYAGKIYNLADTISSKFAKQEVILDYKDSEEKGTVKVHKASVLTGSELVDNKVYRRKLNKLFPEAKALEMEGQGFAVACIRNEIINWILIKGVSDKAANKKLNKDRCQLFAIRQAIRFVSCLLDEIGDDEKDKFKNALSYVRKNSVFISGSYDKLVD